MIVAFRSANVADDGFTFAERMATLEQLMTESNRLVELFDPKANLSISEHFRPHWSQAGAIVFITFRTADSIPQEVLDRWEREKHDWMRQHNFPIDRHWSEVLPTLDPPIRDKFKKEFNRCREDFLDTCQGDCVLRKPELAEIVVTRYCISTASAIEWVILS